MYHAERSELAFHSAVLDLMAFNIYAEIVVLNISGERIYLHTRSPSREADKDHLPELRGWLI